MGWKNLTQRSLADAMLIDHDALKELDDVHELIDWSRLEHRLSAIHCKVQAEKAWPALMIFKVLLLQSWYRLSDPALEKQLARDLLFRRFTGLDISESVPDHSTFWRFRQKLETLSLMDGLLSDINTQLSEQGLYIKSGEVSIVDASVIEAKRSNVASTRTGMAIRPRIAKRTGMSRQVPLGSVKAPMATRRTSMLMKMGLSNQRPTRQATSMTPTALPIY